MGTLAELNVQRGDVVEGTYRGRCPGTYREKVASVSVDRVFYESGAYDLVDDGDFRIVFRASGTPPFGDGEGWSEWTSASEWDVSKHDVQMECIDGIHRVRTRPRQPVRETVTMLMHHIGEGAPFIAKDMSDPTHQLDITIIDGEITSIDWEKLS